MSAHTTSDGPMPKPYSDADIDWLRARGGGLSDRWLATLDALRAAKSASPARRGGGGGAVKFCPKCGLATKRRPNVLQRVGSFTRYGPCGDPFHLSQRRGESRRPTKEKSR